MDSEKKVREALDFYIKRAQKVWPNITDLELLEVRFDLKGLAAGEASYTRWALRFNLEYIKQDVDVFLHDTVPHELAHIITDVLTVRLGLPHGKAWKNTVRALGCEPNIHHKFKPVPTRRIKWYAYSCKCKTHMISAIRHNRIQRKECKYYCNECNWEIFPTLLI